MPERGQPPGSIRVDCVDKAIRLSARQNRITLSCRVCKWPGTGSGELLRAASVAIGIMALSHNPKEKPSHRPNSSSIPECGQKSVNLGIGRAPTADHPGT